MRKVFLASAAAASVITGVGVGGGAAMAQSGTYQQSCRNATSANGVLTAECSDTASRYHTSTLAYGQCRGDISNNNGILSCNGATGAAVASSGGRGGPGQGQTGQGQFGQGQNPQGQYGQGQNPQGQYGQGQNRQGQYGQGQYGQGQPAPGQGYAQNNGGQGDNRRRDNGGQVAADVAAGVIIGGLLGDRVAPPPPPPPPAYAARDRGFDDRARDPRFAQGGWGFGHRPDEWVPIQERADWLEKRIDRSVATGRLNRRDARDLRRQLFAIEDKEEDYIRDRRLDFRAKAELDQRFEDLSRRIHFEEDRF